MQEMKLNLIADNIHYPIPVSNIEKQIISTQIFNRLHNILQNSTVYLTYPSNRTTRFIHSLGCMHLAGLLFQYGLNNAEINHRNKFLDDAGYEIEQIKNSTNFKGHLRQFIRNDDELARIEADSNNIIHDPIYTSSMPGGLAEEYFLSYIIVFQSLRLHALLHDLGHPPFSHITEKAFEEIVNNIQKKQENELTTREKYFAGIIERIIGHPLKEKQFERNFHEHLGQALEKVLLERLIPDCDKKSDIAIKSYCYKMLIIEQFTIRIYEEENNPFYKSLHNLISSDLDADRLDYVNRDLYNSGLLSHFLNYGRLISSYQLFYRKSCIPNESAEKFYPSFLPSVRSISNIEEFFRLRFDLYKYVIFHHRVTKTDGLLRKVIVQLAESYLQENDTVQDNGNTNYLLPEDISGLWKVMDPDIIFDEDIIHNYIQWDDSWLFSVLRKKFFEFEHENENSTLDSKDQLIRIQLEEILSNKKFYYSLYKRVDTFIPVDEAFLESIPTNFTWKELSIKFTQVFNQKNPIPLEERIEGLQKYSDDFKMARENKYDEMIEVLRESRGFFITNLITLLRHSFVVDVDKITNAALTELTSEFRLSDAIIMTRNITPGVDKSFELIVEGENSHVVHICSVSRIADDLKRSSLLFPPFFVFTFKGEASEDLDIEVMRKRFGLVLWKAFKDWLDHFPEGDQK
jgi:HD superfamily phosphohydrolase